MQARKANFKWILWLILLLCSGSTFAQFAIEIASLPGNTPPNSSIYATGSFNDWDPADSMRVFKPDELGRLRLEINAPALPMEYKFTRGSWDSVEGDEYGNATNNRKLEGLGKDTVIKVHISSWEDFPLVGAQAMVRILVTSIPKNTPPDAPIYIVGNFNSWHPGDPKYKLEKNEEGNYETKVPMLAEQLEYKFCRGNWQTVEGRNSGRARFNREFVREKGQENIVYAEIETWEDISGNPINAFTFIWLLAGILGILLIVAINTLQNNNVVANRVLSVLILLISMALIGRVAIYDRDIFQQSPQLLLVPDLILFLYAPVFVFYLRKLLWDAPIPWNSPLWFHFIPFGLHLIAWFPLYTLDNGTLISQNTDLGLRPWFIITGGLALAYNTVYWLYARKLIRNYQLTADNNYSNEQNLSFLKTVMWLKGICLVIWLGSYVIGGLDRFLEIDLERATERSQDVLFIAFSLTVFCLGYFAIREPEIFKMPPELEVEPAVVKVDEEKAVEPEEWEEMKRSLGTLMETERLYLNPKLTLASLADQVGTNVHTLSKVINEGFGVNFNDYVNGYRVEAFKDRVVQEEFKNHTFLSIALMVGFNSKTAFNRSFKKITQLTPREYLKQKADSIS